MPFRGDRLKEARAAAGLSQTDLAELLKSTQNQVQRYENGIQQPSGEKVAEMASILQCSADWFLDLSNDARPQIADDSLTPDEWRIVKAFRRGEMAGFFEVINTALSNKKQNENP